MEVDFEKPLRGTSTGREYTAVGYIDHATVSGEGHQECHLVQLKGTRSLFLVDAEGCDILNNGFRLVENVPEPVVWHGYAVLRGELEPALFRTLSEARRFAETWDRGRHESQRARVHPAKLEEVEPKEAPANCL